MSVACSSIVELARYIILASSKNQNPIQLTDIISISELGLGDQGTVTLTQQDRVVELPDGVRKLPQLTFTNRFKRRDLLSELVKKKLFDWYNARNTMTYDLHVLITNRNFCVTHSYKYFGCSIKDIKENGKEMGKSDMSIITTTVLPYDIVYLSEIETLADIGRPG